MTSTRPALWLLAIACTVWFAFSPRARAATCPVPSAVHPTIGAALRDGGCTTIQLAAGGFPESVEVGRDVAIAGAGSGASSVEGRLAAFGAGVEVTLSSLAVDATGPGVAGCWTDAVVAGGGARVASGPDVVVLQTTQSGGECRIFVDGFDSGGVLAWSSSVP